MSDDDLPPDPLDEEDLRPDYLTPGTRVGRYDVVTKLGSGGYGTAYKVTRDNTELAMKVLLADEDAAARSSQRARIKREFGVLAGLSHPNIVGVLEFAVMGHHLSGYPYIVMDLVDGLPVYEWQHQSQPSLRQICATIIKIAAALNSIHGRGISHRDIKSENILVKATGEPVLIDFGIARTKAARTLTKADTLVGTITHFSPEYLNWTGSEPQVRGEDYPFFPQGDGWALGYMFYELVTGRQPFDPRPISAESPDAESAIYNATLKDDPVKPRVANPKIPLELEEVLLEMLCKNQHQRLVGIDLIHRLEDCIREKGPEWEQPFAVPLRDARQPPRRSRPSPHSAGRSKPAVSTAEDSAEAPRGPVSDRAPSSKTPAGSRSSGGPPPPSRDVPPSPTSAPSTSKPTREERTSAPKPPAAFELSEEAGAPDFQASGELSHHERPTMPNMAALEIPSSLKSLSPKTEKETRRLKPVQIVAAALLLVLVGLWGISRSASSPKPVGVNLTHELDDARAAELSQAPVAPEARGSRLPPPAVGIPPVAAAPVPQAPAAVVAPPTAVPVQALAGLGTGPAPAPNAAPRSGVDQADVDRILAKTYGHPTVPGPKTAKAAPKAAPVEDSPFAQVQYIGAAKPAATTTGYGIGTGRRIHVRLKTPLDSRTIGDGPVEFQLISSVAGDGDSVIPALTLGYGRASTSGGRFTLSGTILRLPNGSEVAFSGLAYDRNDHKPGLPAGRTIAPPATQGDSLATTVAKTTANTALSTVSGGTAQDMARGAGSAVVNTTDSSQGGGQTVLLLDTPFEFDLMVQKPF